MFIWITLVVVAVILTLIAVYYLSYKTKSIVFQKNNLFKFSSNITLDDAPSNVEIKNEYDCNVTSLRECLMNDPTTILGCKEYTARCHHFKVDTKTEYGGKEYMIPANKEENIGYALVLDSIADDCNPYHGDLVLITSDPSRNAYTLVCECKQPGFIGNDTILGNCTTIRICNGKIDNINQQFKDIKCICSATEYSETLENGAPVCKTLTILKANELYDDWSDLIKFTVPTQAKTIYSKNISDNINVKQLLDPCQRDFLSGERVTGSVYDASLNGCRITNATNTIPLVDTELGDGTSSINYTLKGNIERVDWYSTIGGVVSSFGAKGKVPSVEALPIFTPTNENPIYLLRDPVAINVNYNTSTGLYTPMPKIACEGHFPKYSCYFSEESPQNLKCGVFLAAARAPPSAFAWGTDNWKSCEAMFTDDSINCDKSVDSKNPAFISYDKFNFASTADTTYSQLGIRFIYNADGSYKRAILATLSVDFFREHVENITPLN